MSAPVSIVTPTISKTPGTEARTQRYLEGCYKKLPFALRGAEAQKQVDDYSKNFADNLLNETADAPVTAKRRIR
jgi:hypothetical protein